MCQCVGIIVAEKSISEKILLEKNTLTECNSSSESMHSPPVGFPIGWVWWSEGWPDFSLWTTDSTLLTFTSQNLFVTVIIV